MDTVQERIDRAEKAMKNESAQVEECYRFEEGDQYVFRHENNYLVAQGTLAGSDKPAHRVRLKSNILKDVVAQKVALVTSRLPNYQVSPSTTDPEDISAARIAEKIAVYGHDKWDITNVLIRTWQHAIIGGEGFAWPYWDSLSGPAIDDGLAEGEVAIKVLSRREVGWETGCRFEDSRWFVVRQARPVDDVTQTPGYIGPAKLTPDAQNENPEQKSFKDSKLVMVTEYLERPSPMNPNGRRIVMANKGMILEEQPYPCTDGNGKPVDEPVLHKLCYFINSNSDRDQGLIEHLLDLVRSRNDARNKKSEFKNAGLMPQILAPVGSFGSNQRISDEPNAIYYYNNVGGQKPEWREPPNPAFIQMLDNIIDQCDRDIATICALNQIPNQVESGKGIQALIEKDRNRENPQLLMVARWFSSIMRHSLYLTQRHYTEKRLIKLRGEFGWEPITDFRGANLRNQCDVTVLPGSFEFRTHEQVTAEVQFYAQMGWVSPQEAMAAINGGTAETLIEDYERDLARANLLIQKIQSGAIMDEPMRFDPLHLMAAGPQDPSMPTDPDALPPGYVPGWMPRDFDNAPLQMKQLSSWMKTPDFDSRPPELQEVAYLIYQGFQMLEAQQQARQMEAQNAMAEQQGMNNAASDQGVPKAMASQPSMTPNGGPPNGP